jgi:hypothetical protein
MMRCVSMMRVAAGGAHALARSPRVGPVQAPVGEYERMGSRRQDPLLDTNVLTGRDAR